MSDPMLADNQGDKLYVIEPSKYMIKPRIRVQESRFDVFLALLMEFTRTFSPCCLAAQKRERLARRQKQKNRMIYFGSCWDQESRDGTALEMQQCHKKGESDNFYSEKVLTNYISTTKYNNLTFLPLNLFEQLQNKANFYFLLIAIVSFTSYSPQSPLFSVTPLVIVLTVAAAKEYYEDYLRGVEDKKVNSSLVDVWDCVERPDSSGEYEMAWVEKTWREIKPGDVVRIKKGEKSSLAFPADLLLLQSSQKAGVCYIETSNLDGETNLKLRQALHETYTIDCKPDGADYCEQAAFKLESVPPNEKMDKTSWEGNLWVVPQLEWESVYKQINEKGVSAENVPLNDQPASPGMDQLLLRGASLRNTDWIIALTVYTGKQTKLMMNLKNTAFKRSNVDRIVDKALYILFAAQFSLCCFGVITTYFYYVNSADNMWYQDIDSDGYSHDDSTYLEDSFLTFFTYLILTSLLIPISLYVTMEMVKFIQAYFISVDEQMYNKELDVNAAARTSNLNEELGQIDFVFSDKTGTLTRNMMEFHSCMVDNVTYGDSVQDRVRGRMPTPKGNPSTSEKSKFQDTRLAWLTQDQAVNEFLTLLSVCHNVVPEIDPNRSSLELTYQAASPDEKALVEFARDMYYWFNKEETRAIEFKDMTFDGHVYTVTIHGTAHDFQIYEMVPFNSTRKRMSVLVKDPRTGKLKLYTKGADNVIFKLLSTESKSSDWTKADEALQQFSSKGLRTLVCAYRDISDEYFNDWRTRYDEAKQKLKNRDFLVTQLQEELESGLTLIGVTAIEDMLQDQVPRVISNIVAAGCAIWVLTGDKVETAINVARSANLLTKRHRREDGSLIVIDPDENLEEEQGYKQTKEILENTWASLQYNPHNDENQGLVMSGKALTYVFPVRKRTHNGQEIPPSRDELEKETVLQELMLEITQRCRAVIMCRVSPKQKSQLVLLIKHNLDAITLAVGDGANDVPMIKAAHVGIGVHGKEGKQAVMNSDYAISQFKDLERLMLVHGAWDYRRLSKLILYTFYKNVTITMTQMWYQYYAQFSGALFYEPMAGSCYNLIYTAFPIIILAIFERPYSEERALSCPELYREGPLNKFFNVRLFLGYELLGVITSLVIFYVPTFVMDGAVNSEGQVMELWATMTTMFTCCVLTVTGKIMIETHLWTICNVIWFILSVLSWYIFALVWALFPVSWQLTDSFYYGSPEMVIVTPEFWLLSFLVPVMCLSPELTYRYFKKKFAPTYLDAIQAAEVVYFHDNDKAKALDKVERARKSISLQEQLIERDDSLSSKHQIDSL